MKLATVIAVLVVGVTPATGQVSHTICDVQQYDAMGLSPLEGDVVTVQGVVTAPPGLFQPLMTSFFIENDECGINVFHFDPGAWLSLGDSVAVTGTVMEYQSSNTGAGSTTMIVLDAIADITVLSLHNPAPQPVDLGISAVPVESNEGRFLRTVGCVTGFDAPWVMYLSDETGSIDVYQANPEVDLLAFDVGDTIRVAGIVMQYDRTPPFFEGYELAPRFQSDMEEWTSTAVAPATWGAIKALFR
jgi:hypothetical protein